MSRHLVDLPSRGLLTVQPGQLGYKHRSVTPKYISLHNTDPPVGQVVRTDPTNILIRSLQRNAKKSASAKECSVPRPTGSSSASSASEGTTSAGAVAGTGATTALSRQRARPTKNQHRKRPKPMDGDEDNSTTGEGDENRRQRRAGT